VKILFLLTQSLDYPSGLGRYAPLARELARLGHQVRVAALHPALDSLEQRTFQDGKVTIHYAGPMHVRQVGHERRYYGPLGLAAAVVRGTWGLAWRALLAEADAVHVCKPHPMNGLAGLLAKGLRGRRLYLDCDDYEAESNRYGGTWQKRVVAFCEDRLPRAARAITVNTRFTQRRLEALGYPPGRIVYVPNGIDRGRFAGLDPARAEALRARLGLAGAPVVLYLGSLSRASHPLDLLLDAFRRVATSHPAARLLLVGGGEDYAALGRQVAGLGLGARVTLTGRVPPEQVPDYYLLGDISVDPVHDDATARARSPLKLFESMAAGRPVLTGDVGDRREHLAGGQAGLLVAPGSSQALAEGMLALLDDPALRREMGRQGRALAGRYYWDVQVHEFVRVYEH
jgi:glycosyltransferase involved in cell wall biosynthesis